MTNKSLHSHKLRNTILVAGAALTLGLLSSNTKVSADNIATENTISSYAAKANTSASLAATPAANSYAAASSAISATRTASAAKSAASSAIASETSAIDSEYAAKSAAQVKANSAAEKELSDANSSAYAVASSAVNTDPTKIPGIESAAQQNTKHIVMLHRVLTLPMLRLTMQQLRLQLLHQLPS